MNKKYYWIRKCGLTIAKATLTRIDNYYLTFYFFLIYFSKQNNFFCQEKERQSIGFIKVKSMCQKTRLSLLYLLR